MKSYRNILRRSAPDGVGVPQREVKPRFIFRYLREICTTRQHKPATSAYKTLATCLLAATMLFGLIPTPSIYAQDGFVGDGFGGRAWYKPAPVTTGGYNGAYIDPDGQLIMWGTVDHTISPSANEGGNDGVDISCPYTVTGEDNVKLVSLNYRGLNALVRNDGSSAFWAGTNINDGYTYDGEPYFRTLTAGVTDAKHASASTHHVVFVKDDGTVWSIGSNRYGAFGDGTTNNTFVTTPVQMNGITNAVRAIAFGGGGPQAQAIGTRLYRGANVVLTEDGEVFIAGGGGTIGGDFTADSTTPVQKNISNVVDIKAGIYGVLALTANGDVYAWGEDGSTNSLGLGNPSNTAITIREPQKINFPIGTPSIVAIEASTLSGVKYAIDENGDLWSWGPTAEAALFGTNEGQTAIVPMRVAHHVADVDTAYRHTYLFRDASYPLNERVWTALVGTTRRLMTLNPEHDRLSGAGTVYDSSDPLSWDHGIGNGIVDWATVRPDLMGDCGVLSAPFGGIPAGAVGPNNLLAGTQNCDETYIIGDLTPGTASDVIIKVSADVTTVGEAAFTISGSGFTTKADPYVVMTESTGEQDFYVPVSYDGSALGSVTFGIDGLVSACTADLSGITPTPIISPLTVLPIGEFCAPVTPATLSK